MSQLFKMGLSGMLLITLMNTPLFASEMSASQREQIFLETLQKNIASDYKINFSWNLNTDEKKEESVKKEKTPEPIVKKSKGESKVEEMLRIQREKIKNSQKQKKSYSATKSDWMEQKAQDSNRWVDEKLNEQNQWQKEKLAVLKKWALEKEKYKKEIPELKKDLTDLNELVEKLKSSKVNQQKIVEKEVHTPDIHALGFQIMNEEFQLPIRTQGRRSTCAAFAAVRSMEILLRREKNPWELSEQYFYYASKPKCQTSPCSKKGSWPLPAFDQAIPLESQCPYIPLEKSGNETQIPLAQSCSGGRVKVTGYNHLSSRQDIQTAIRQGSPVIGGFKLDDAFYNNKGFVSSKKENSNTLADKHASGHALLLVGVLDLPQELWATQGKHCTLVANSWGEGWGLGGHACLSDAWFDKYRYQFDFLGVKSISLN